MSTRCNDILLSSSKNKVSFYVQQGLDELGIHLDTACDKYQGEREGEGGERGRERRVNEIMFCKRER